MAAAPDDDARRTLAELEAKLRELERELLRGHPEQAPPAAAPTEPPAAEPASPDPLAEPAPPDPLGTGLFPEAPPSEHDALAPHGDPLGAAADRIHPKPFPEPSPPPDAFQPAAEPEPLPEPPSADAPAEPDSIASYEQLEPPPPTEPPPPALDLDALAAAQEILAGLHATVEGLEEVAGRITVEARAVVDDHGRSLARLELAARAAARAEEAAAEAGRVAGTVVVEAGPFADPAPLLALRDALAAHPGTKDAYVRGVEDGRAVIEVHLDPPPASPSTPSPGA